MQPILPFAATTELPADCHDLPDGWQYVKLGTVANISSGGTPSRTVRRYWGGTVPWLTTSAINFNLITEPSEMITQEGLEHSSAKLFPIGTVLMAMYGQGATRGRVAILKIKAAVNQACATIQPSKEVYPEYLFYFLMSRYDQIRQIGHGGNQKNLNAHLIRSMSLSVPPLAEQARIVEILDAADVSVRATEALIEAKVRYKCALAEPLLTGQRRFPEFAGQAWKHLPIGDFAEQQNERNMQIQAYPVLSCTKHRGLVLSSDYFGKRIHSENLTDYKIVRRDHFAYATNHIEEGSIGLQNLCDAGLVSPMYTVFAADSSQADETFLYALLKTECLPSAIRFSYERVRVNRRGSLRWPSFAKIQVELPSLEEQRRIADTLGLIDEEIALLRRQLNAQKKQKQGLMHKLLTGQVRVKEFAP